MQAGHRDQSRDSSRRPEDVVAHRCKREMGCSGHCRRIAGFFQERDDATVGVCLDDAECPRLLARNGNGRNSEVGTSFEVKGDHLSNVHLEDVVAAEDAHVIGGFVRDHVLRLVDRVRGSAKPALARSLLCRNGLDEIVEHRRKPPAASDVLLKRCTFVLR